MADVNHDGIITPQEVFDMIDANRDNVLSRDEFYLACEKLEVGDLLSLRKSLARSELSRTHSPDMVLDTLNQSIGSLFSSRMITTAEVALSKIFPAGFGWQLGASVAALLGAHSTELGFFLMTGVGDSLGVFCGHVLYMTAKKLTSNDPSIDIRGQEVPTALLLATAAMCSGSIWQPLVNVLQAAGVPFGSTLMLATAICGLSFFTGLRAGRALYHPRFPGIAQSSYANLKADAFLSLAVGGASGAFVGTDISYGAANWLSGSVGIPSTSSAFNASILAGSSTALGFTAVQSAQNVLIPAGKNWVD
ncbi:MAG: EF-hand domain-containing protein [archaeon]|nr:EF-hand domain-containing protein [archaeon]